MMNNSLHLLLCYLPCPDIHPSINLPRISIDDLAIIFLCELYREGSLATRRRSIDHEEFWFIGGCSNPGFYHICHFVEFLGKTILLFLKNNDNTLDNYSKIEDITKDIDAECGLFVHCGTDEDVEYIFKYADYYITNRSKETVYHSCMADKYNVQMLSGVDIPVF